MELTIEYVYYLSIFPSWLQLILKLSQNVSGCTNLIKHHYTFRTTISRQQI